MIAVFQQKNKSTILYRFLRPASLKRFFNKHPEAYADCASKEKRRICWKMRVAYILWDIVYLDFWRSRAETLSWAEIRDIVPYKRQEALWRRINAPSARAIFANKAKIYQHFGDYYHREALLVEPDCGDLSEFFGFMTRHPRFAVKPLSGHWGNGFRIVDSAVDTDVVEHLSRLYPNGFLAEELIVQDSSVGQLHPESVNTLRIQTYMGPDGIEIKWPCLRMGRGNSIVDNAGAGGVFGAVDVASGTIIGVCDESHNVYEVHPDTGVPIIGFRIPRWEEACQIAKKMAQRIPACQFIAWDLALTPDGWVLVEGNYFPLLIWQMASGKGIRKEFEIMERDADRRKA